MRPPTFGRPADPVRPAGPVRPADPDVYVYRDTGGQPDDPAAATPGPDEQDAAYWYDLPGTGTGGDSTPRVPQETRGPFEPLVSSAGPPGAAPGDGQEAPGDGQEETAHAHARKLEQIKDLYLTAEAIGEVNVDKHFDQLLAQQRELVSDYFKQSNATRPPGGPGDQAGTELDGAAGQAGTEPGDPGEVGGSASVPGSARAVADQPRVW